MKCSYCKKGHFPVCSSVQERLPGGFAEYILVPDVLIRKGTYLLPDGISYDQSTFIEPLACVVRAQRLAEASKNRTLMVIGCGMSGLLHVKLAKAHGCRVISVDVNEKRLESALIAGADMIMNASDDHDRHPGQKTDVVVLCTSAMPAIERAWRCVDRGGAVVFFAVPPPDRKVHIPINDFWTREIRVLTSYYCGPPDIVEAMDLLESGTIEIDDMITHRLPLKDISRGFRMVIDGRESLKVIIRPNE